MFVSLHIIFYVSLAVIYYMKVRYFRYCIIMLAVMAAMGCSRQNDAGSASADITEMVEEFDPSTIIDEEPQPEPEPAKPEEPQIDTVAIDALKSTNEAIEWMDASADADKYREGVIYRIAKDSPDYAKRLLKNKFDYFIVVDKPSMFVVLYDKYGREKSAYKMACARNFGSKAGKNDCRTPEGFFSAGDTYDATDWLYTDENGYTSPTKGVYGPRFVRVVNPVSGTIGIHGTGSPGSLGRRTSHGCIRLHNNSILDLVQYVKKGMPIIVNPSDRDQKVNKQEGRKVTQIHIGKPEHVVAPPETKKADEKKEETKPVEKPDTASAVITTVEPEQPAPDADDPSAANASDPVYD